jgi:hypothetical protein
MGLTAIIIPSTFVPKKTNRNYMTKMKQMLSFILLVSVALAGYGQTPVFQWGAVLRSNDTGSASATNAAASIRTNSAGDIFVYGTFASTKTLVTNNGTNDFKNISYRHYDAQGAPTVLTSSDGAKTAALISGNDNFFLYKMDRDGKIAWQVTSDRGSVDLHYSQFTPTADGGVLLLLNTRISGSNNDDEFDSKHLIRIIQADGSSKYSVKREEYDATVNKNVEQGVAVKIDRNGMVEWGKVIIRVDDTPINNRNPSGIFFHDLTTDADGNYWVAGRYVRTLTFDTPGGGTRSLTPHNTGGWDGDSQNTRGDALLVKLNPNGEYLWHLETTGTVEYQSVNSLHHDNGALFLYGNIEAATDLPTTSSSAFLGHTLYPDTTINAYSARLDVSGETPAATWATLLQSRVQTNRKGGRIKVTNLSYDSGALFLNGSFTGFIEAAGDTILQNELTGENVTASLKGFIVRQDPATGAIVGKVKDNTGGITETENVVLRQNKIYVFGYALGSTWVHVYDADLNRLDGGGNFLQSEGATAWDALFLDDRIITLNRGRNINPVGGTIAGAPAAFVGDDPAAYSAFILSYGLDGLRNTAIDQPAASPEAIRIVALPGAIRIAGHAQVKIFSISGAQRYAGIVDGEEEIPLPAGLYIVTANGRATKVISYTKQKTW